MEKIIVRVEWCDKNYGATVGDNVPGAMVVTADTYEKLQKEVAESVRFHVECLVEDGENVPQWLVDGDYEFDWQLDVSALIRVCEPYISLSALSRETGINQRQLSHYANGIKIPRSPQRIRIINGIHNIGRRLMTVV
jgi:predicted RNase H-like HicB family nuclease